MDTQNITLSLPKSMLARIKVLAAQRGTSVSRILVTALEDVVQRDRTYERARRKHLALLRRPLNLGSRGARSWTRDELHER